MPCSIIFHMKSGRSHRFQCDPGSPEDPQVASKQFHDAMDFSSTTTLQIEGAIIYAREIESIEFVAGGGAAQ